MTYRGNRPKATRAEQERALARILAKRDERRLPWQRPHDIGTEEPAVNVKDEVK